MNKLIITGNGFDLAHGLPTSYNHFMDAFWRDLYKNIDTTWVEELISYDKNEVKNYIDSHIKNYKDFESRLTKYITEYNKRPYNFGINFSKDDFFKFENQFFKKLNEIQSIQNWVDVENEYYQMLKDICKNNKLKARQKREKIEKLHKEFEKVKQLLERYLQNNVVEAYDFRNPQTGNYYMYDGNRHPIGEIINYIEPSEGFTFYIVNFNYTPTLELFYSAESNEINHIHGRLEENIVFGFGDEMDDDYKLIEDMDDNEYLRYFKSFQYVQNSNYKDILRYIDSGKFQVIIMGHSCGLSDRTLLNTIFEHDNCRSIKVFYHKYGEKEGEDNYTEIIQNISRHFKDKELMRNKIVEKTLCGPMPQIQLPKKE